MSREIDRRDFSTDKTSESRTLELAAMATEISEGMPGVQRVSIAGIDTVTGNAASVVSESLPGEKGNYVSRAMEHVQMIGSALGLAATQPAEFVADPHFQTTSSGTVSVHLQQKYKGISIFQATETVRFAPNGSIDETMGSSVTVAQEKEIAPKLAVQEAVSIAAKHVAKPDTDEQDLEDKFGEPMVFTSVDMSEFEPQIIACFADNPECQTVLKSGPFGDKIKANLVWFPMADNLILGWECVITMPNLEGQYRVIVDAENGEILYCRQLMLFATARGNVFQVDGSGPRQEITFPLDPSEYGLPVPDDLPAVFPEDWVAADQTVGNSTHAHLGRTGPSVRGQQQDGFVVFNPEESLGDDQKVLNIFYYNCYMHDYFYLLGFRESDGNFQQENRGRGGAQRDRVDARAHSGTVPGTANMSTPIDGSNPIMNMGLVGSTNRHTAFDSSVVFHEFMHGVTNRLVGGRLNSRALEQQQSRGMGEGWGDYIACTINDKDVVGDWVVDNPVGIRKFAYNNFPDNFKNLGTGRYNQEHNIGEIWCAALLEMNRQIGAEFAVQLVVDALKPSPANPSFLTMRDSILKALDDMLSAGKIDSEKHASSRAGIWAAFAKFGMGPMARSNGASLSGIVADFDAPTEAPSGEVVRVESTPNLSIPDDQPVGVSSTLSFLQTGRIRRLTVSIDVKHTYIGDLRVTLIPPVGAPVTLHDRTGASSNDLVQSYTSEGIPGLADLIDSPAHGEWTLSVSDNAGIDLGTLRKWAIEVELDSDALPRGEATPGLAIPDDNPAGIASTIGIIPSGSASRISVGVDITHSYIGDLQVELVAPSGGTALLHNRSGGSLDNLITAFDSDSHAALAGMIGEEVQGNWTLRVSDHAGVDVGKLNRWSIELST